MYAKDFVKYSTLVSNNNTRSNNLALENTIVSYLIKKTFKQKTTRETDWVNFKCRSSQMFFVQPEIIFKFTKSVFFVVYYLISEIKRSQTVYKYMLNGVESSFSLCSGLVK